MKIINLLFIKKIKLTRFTQTLGLIALLSHGFACSPSEFASNPRKQEITTIKWSPNGKTLAFIYQNNSNSNLNHILYTLDINDKRLTEILQVNSKEALYKEMPYRIFQWSSNEKILAGDNWRLFEVDTQKKVRELLSDLPTQNNDFYIKNTCSFSGGRYIILHRDRGLPIWLDTQDNKKKELDFTETNPFLGSHQYISQFVCASQGNSVFISSSGTGGAGNLGPLFTTAGINPENAKLQNYKIFNPFSQKPLSKEDAEFSFSVLGWKSNLSLFYAFTNGSTLEKVVEQNFDNNTATHRKDISVLGEFSPDFQWVAYIEAYERSNYLVIAKPDGTSKSRLLRVDSLPKGNLPI